MKLAGTLAAFLWFFSCSANVAVPGNTPVPAPALRPAAVLVWQAPIGVEPYYRYNLYKADGTGPFAVIAPELNKLSFTDYNVKKKHSYRYQVTTIDSVSMQQSVPSNTVTANF